MTIMNRWFEEVWNQGRESPLTNCLAMTFRGTVLHRPMATKSAAWIRSRPTTARCALRCLIST